MDRVERQAVQAVGHALAEDGGLGDVYRQPMPQRAEMGPRTGRPRRVNLGDDWRGSLLEVVRQRQELAGAEWSIVEAARARGATWTEIAEALGISRQSAHERFAKSMPTKAVKGERSSVSAASGPLRPGP
jgi:hypothetical protein